MTTEERRATLHQAQEALLEREIRREEVTREVAVAEKATTGEEEVQATITLRTETSEGSRPDKLHQFYDVSSNDLKFIKRI